MNSICEATMQPAERKPYPAYKDFAGRGADALRDAPAGAYWEALERKWRNQGFEVSAMMNKWGIIYQSHIQIAESTKQPLSHNPQEQQKKRPM